MSILQDLESHILSPALLHAAGVPSASIAVLSDGKISSHVITSGSENEETIYQACSISKAITGIAVAKLVEQGKVSYSTPVTDHLPQSVIDTLVDKETAHLLPLVTVGMLLSHTSGLSQGGFSGYESDPPTAETVLSGQAPANTPRVRFATFPGAQMSYSGGGSTVLQVFLETLLGQPFQQFMHYLVLQPLGMTRSHFGALPESESNWAAAHYTAYVRSRAGQHILPELAAAGLWTTPTDLLKAISAVQRSLESDGGFLKPETAKTMLEAKQQCWAKGNYNSHGFFVSDDAFGHAGSSDPGYRCYALGSHGGFADTSRASGREGGERSKSKTSWGSGNGLAIMTNSVNGLAVLGRMLQAVFYLQKWPCLEVVPSWPFAGEWVPYAASPDTAITDGWKDWIGEWEGGWKLEDRDGVPALNFQDSGALTLRPAAAPEQVLASGQKETCFVAVGVNIAVKLTWEGDERALRVVQDSGKTLKRA